MIDRVVGFNSPQRQSFYFMFFVKSIQILDLLPQQSLPQIESKMKFAIYKGIQIFNQTRQPITVDFTNGQAVLQKVELSFFLKDYNVNRKVDFVMKLLKVENVSQELIGQLLIETHKYIDLYLKTGIDRVDQQGKVGPYKITYAIFTDKTRHDLQKIVKSYKEQSASQSKETPKTDKQQKTKQAAREIITSKFNTPTWKRIQKQQQGHKQQVEQGKQQKQDSHQKSGVNQSGLKSEGSKVVYSQWVKYDDIDKEISNVVEQTGRQNYLQSNYEQQIKQVAEEDIKQYVQVAHNANQGQQQEQEEKPQRVTLTYDAFEEPRETHEETHLQQQFPQSQQPTTQQLEQEIQHNLQQDQQIKKLIEAADTDFQNAEIKDSQERPGPHSYNDGNIQNQQGYSGHYQDGPHVQEIQHHPNKSNQPSLKLNQATGKWQTVGASAQQVPTHNWLNTSRQKINQDAVSQIVQNINFSNPPKYYDRNKQYFQPPKQEIIENKHMPGQFTPRDFEQEPLANILEEEGKQLIQSGGESLHFKQQVRQKINKEQQNMKIVNKIKTQRQQTNKQTVSKQKQSKIRPVVSLKYTEEPSQEIQQPLKIDLQKVQVDETPPKSNFKLTLKILIVIIITGMIFYFLLRSPANHPSKITGPKSHHKSGTKMGKVQKKVKVAKIQKPPAKTKSNEKVKNKKAK